MDNSRIVDRCQTIACFRQQAAQFLARRWVQAKPVIERGSLQELHHQVGAIVRRRQGSVRNDLDDVLVLVKFVGGFSLDTKTFAGWIGLGACLGSAVHSAAQDLDRNAGSRLRHGFVHRAHGSRAQKSGDGPGTDHSSDGERVLTVAHRRNLRDQRAAHRRAWPGRRSLTGLASGMFAATARAHAHVSSCSA